MYEFESALRSSRFWGGILGRLFRYGVKHGALRDVAERVNSEPKDHGGRYLYASSIETYFVHVAE